MTKFVGLVLTLTIVALLTFSQSNPASAQVIVNNFLSPFTTIEVGPGYHRYRPYYYYSYSGYGSYDTGYYPQRHYYEYDPYGYDHYGPRYYDGPGYYDRRGYW